MPWPVGSGQFAEVHVAKTKLIRAGATGVMFVSFFSLFFFFNTLIRCCEFVFARAILKL